MSATDPVLRTWAQGFSVSSSTAAGSADALPAHHPQCLGCGPDNPHGHHLVVWREGERVRTRHVFDGRHVGAPGIAHGGAVATVLDDLFGFLLYAVGEIAVTRHLEVGYRAPVLLGVPYLLEAGVERREGRKLFVVARGTDEQGALVVEAKAVFIIVGFEHFTRAVADGGSRPPVVP